MSLLLTRPDRVWCSFRINPKVRGVPLLRWRYIPRVARRIIVVVLAVGFSLLVLDLVFLGILAKPFFDAALGELRREPVYWPSALLFYAMYVSVLSRYAVFGAESARDATRRGAALGFVAYATYELTNWAVLAGWPAVLVPVDIAWGVVLTATCAFVGRKALQQWG